MTGQPSPLPQTDAIENAETFNDQPALETSDAGNASKKSSSAFRTISEVADELNVQQHVLRFWETKFSEIRPLKRGGGRRYYRPEDVDLLKTIHKLLYTEGYTIKGAQKLFRDKGKNQVVEKSPPPIPAPRNENRKNEAFSDKQKAALRAIAGELRDLRALLVQDE